MAYKDFDRDLKYEMSRLCDAEQCIKKMYPNQYESFEYMNWNDEFGRSMQRNDIDWLALRSGIIGCDPISLKFRSKTYPIQDVTVEVYSDFKKDGDAENVAGCALKSMATSCLYLNEKFGLMYDAFKMRAVLSNIKKDIHNIKFDDFDYKDFGDGVYSTTADIVLGGKIYTKIRIFKTQNYWVDKFGNEHYWTTVSIAFPLSFFEDAKINYNLIQYK